MDITDKNVVEEHDSTQHYEVLQELGDCYTSVGNYAQAQHCYEKAASMGPDEPGPYVGLGVIALQKNLLDLLPYILDNFKYPDSPTLFTGNNIDG